MTEKLLKELQNKLASISLERWKESPCSNSNNLETVRWLFLLKISSEFSLGLVEDGYWVKDSGVSITVFTPETPLVFLLPCLEIQHDKFHNMIETAFLKLELPKELVGVFPSSELVYTGLSIDSRYWSELALKWAEKIQIDDKLKQALIQTRDSGLTQTIRHKAKKLLYSD